MNDRVVQNILQIELKETKYKIFLPQKDTDYIQGKIYKEKIPYEYEMLLDIKERMWGERGCFLDIGANIGNHSLFLSAYGFKIYAFEANQELCESMQISKKINGFADLNIFKFGLSDEEGRAKMDNLNVANLGAQSLKIGEGDIELKTLDSLLLEDKISVIKIDVEGMEVNVLKGSTETIRKNRPLMYIEALNNVEFRKIYAVLETMGYVYWRTFNASPTHLFVPKEKKDEKDVLSNNGFSNALESYRITQILNQNKRIISNVDSVLNSLVMYRNKLKEIDELKRNNNKKIEQYQKEIDELKRNNNNYRNLLQQKECEMQGVRNTLSYRIGNRVVTSKNVMSIIKLPYYLYKDYQAFKKYRRKKNGVVNVQHLKNNERCFEKINVFGTKKKYSIQERNQKKIKVASIMDEFTYFSFSYECELFQLSLKQWKQEISNFQPQLLFIESAWQGKNEEWKLRVSNFSSELQELIQYCKNKNIPTLFWNKEDPVHFETFLPVACAVDFIFTTDIDCIPKYKFYAKHENVYCLPFAAQTKIHNPMEEFQRKDEFNFAGSYYLKYPQRQMDFNNVIQAVSAYRNVSIYDRNYHNPHPHYSFPDSFKDMIIGNLPFNEINKAYKGYRFGITMNTVKHSQTMFARRAFELIASNTLVVSNFSRALRNFFGDLVVSSDDSKEIKKRLEKICNDEMHQKKIRLNALRKVMREHTYRDRFAFIVSTIFNFTQEFEKEVWLLGVVRAQREYDLIAESFLKQQCVANKKMIIFNLSGEAIDNSHNFLSFTNLQDFYRFISSKEDCLFGLINSQDYYGKHYLIDLVLGLKYSNFNAYGKSSYFKINDSEELIFENGVEYTLVSELKITSSLVKSSHINYQLLEKFIHNNFIYCVDNMFAIDCFNYCENGLEITQGQKNIVEDMLDVVDYGIDMQQLKDTSSFEAVIRDNFDTQEAFKMDAKFIYDNLEKPESSKIRFELVEGEFLIESKLEESVYKYFYFSEIMHREKFNMVTNSSYYLKLNSSMKEFRVVFEFLDIDKNKISHSIDNFGKTICLAIPNECVFIRFGIRVKGRGKVKIHSLILGALNYQPYCILSKSKNLILTKQYPAYDDIYRYGFLHARVKSYKDNGLMVDVFRLSDKETYNCREFEGVDVVTASSLVLEETLKSGRYTKVLIHLIDKNMWDIVKNFIDNIEVHVWVHGAEIQMWQRREYEFELMDDIEIERQKRLSAQRKKLWQEIVGMQHKNLHFIFVSEHFKNESLGDMGLMMPKERYSIIHNYINTDLFKYQPKYPEDRLKILSIRPFSSKKYANDLTIKAILELSQKDFFSQLEFLIIGDGYLFDELIEPIKNFPNVKFQKKFLQHQDIAKIHKNYGIFLVPTRMDAQGVSRDEAMSSGLVPVTNDVAAIPEFVSNMEDGILVEAENYKALAKAIEFLYENPKDFLRMSANAAKRVREQSGYEQTIVKEINVISKESLKS